MSHFHPRKGQTARGGGVLTSAPPPAAAAASYDGGLESHVSPTASTSAIDISDEIDDARRTRELSLDSTTMDDVELPDISSPVKKRKVPRSAPSKPASKKAKAKSPIFEATLPWPEHFVKLEKTFKALNTVYTFASSRKGMSLTFDILQSSVEALLKRPLLIHDISQIKSLLPDLITFAYIDEELMRIHSSGGDETASRRAQKRMELDEAYAKLAGPSSTKAAAQVVLQFSFNDGEVRSSNGVGKIASRKFSKKKKDDDPSKPVEKVAKYTAASMAVLITKRNEKFHLAVDELLVACAGHDPIHDPVILLLEATEDHLPVEPSDDAKGLLERKEDLDFYRRNPDQRPSIERIIEEMEEEDIYRSQIVEGGHKIVEARDATFGVIENDLSQALWDALYSTKKIIQLYSHQALAINHLARGKSVIVSTSTSSGKSLIYQVPLVKALEEDNGATAMFIFPTKALAQDQKRSLGELLGACEGMEDIKIATFDGDTARDDRDHIRENANVIFTNPDMLHLTILPHEEKWRRFFRNLKFVVLDELHMYAGLFGSHVAFVIRRLRRVCAALGNRHVQFVSCSATIANPAEHMQTLCGLEDVVVVGEDGSPTGRKEYLVWNPPMLDDQDPKQGRVSTITETSRIFRFLMDRGVRSIVFCKVRKQCEILMKQVRNDLMLEGRSDLAARIMAYRSGYSAADRRKIESEMFSGQLLGVVATTALELGVDIGSLDAVISVGFPYTLPGLRQQAGRAGRRNKDSLAMLICDPFPLDQHYARNPQEIFDSPFTGLNVDLENPIVVSGHLQCAAHEMPVHPIDDLPYFGPLLPAVCEEHLIGDKEGFFHCPPSITYPAKLVPIRNTEDEKYDIIDISGGKHEVIEEIELSRAIFTVYEGAVYMHQGRTFLVKEVNHDRKIALVEQATLEFQTRQRDFTNVDALDTLAIRQVKGSDISAFYGTVNIESVVFGYFKTDRRNNILDMVELSTPPFIRQSHGLWIDVPRSALEILLLKNIHPAGSIHAAEHALLSLTPIFAMSVEGDVKTECKQPEKELARNPSTRKRPARLILYDSSGKSGGVCAKAFDNISDLLAQAADCIAACPCIEGCPSCVASSVCSGANAIVSKLGARIVLDSILGRDIDVDSIPMQELLVGAVPGGSIDLQGLDKPRQGPGRGMARGVMATEEMEDGEKEERARVLAELMGGFMR